MRSQLWPRWGWQEKNENGVEYFLLRSLFTKSVLLTVVAALVSWVQIFFISSNFSHRKSLAHNIHKMCSMDVMILQVGPQVKQRHSNFTGRSYSIFSKVRLTCKLIALQTWSIKGFFAMSLNTKLFVTKCLGLSRTGSFGMTYIQAWIEIVHFWCWRIMVARKEGLLIFFFHLSGHRQIFNH